MDTTYELWDIETSNIIGSFPSVGEALDVVLTLLDAYGSGYANDLALTRRHGTLEAGLAATGKELLDLSERHAADRAKAAPAAMPSD